MRPLVVLLIELCGVLALFVFIASTVYPSYLVEDDEIVVDYSEYRVAIIGNSVTGGRWFEGYFKESLVNYLGGGSRVTVKNFSHDGLTISDIRETSDWVIDNFKPTHLVIFGGIDDCVRYDREPIYNAVIVANGIDGIIIGARFDGVHVVVVDHYPWRDSIYNKRGRGWYCSLVVNDFLHGSVSDLKGVSVVDSSSVGWCKYDPECKCENGLCNLDGNILPKLYHGDGLHLTESGKFFLSAAIVRQVGW